MDTMEAKMAEWRRKMPSKRQLTSQLGKIVQEKSVAVLYTQDEQVRIKSTNELIAKATSEFDKEEHWDRIMKVVDVVGNTSNKHVLKEAVRFLRLRLGDPSPRVVLLALSLTEALVKNCNRYVQKEIASEAFMSEMESLYKVHSCKRGRESMEIEGRVLELIQAWGEAFMNQKFDFPFLIYTYEKLRKKGVRFPKYNKEKAPIFSNNPDVRASSFSSSSSLAGTSTIRSNSSSSSSNSIRSINTDSRSSSSSLSKLSSKEVYHVAVNVAEMFDDMIHEAESDNGSLADRGVIVELAAQANELVHRLQSVIESAAESESDDLGKYLAVNDQLHLAIVRYDELKANNAGKTKPSGAGNKSKTAETQRRNTLPADTFGFGSGGNNQQEDDDDDEFGDFVRARVGGEPKSAPTKSSSSSNNQTEEEDDPFASFVEQRATKKQENPEVKAPAPAKDLIDLWDDEPLQPQPPAAAPVTASVDLWESATILQPCPPVPTQPASSMSGLDDIWGDLATPAPAAAPTPAPTVATPAPAPTANKSNPFDFFDDFTTKTSISAPVAPPARAQPAPTVNPFDFSSFPPPTAAPATTAGPAKTSNPFDF